MKKIILWSVVGILIAGLAAGAFWWWIRPQVIQLDKTTKLTLLGVEYGKHHKFPKVKITGRRTGGGPTSFDTTNDTLVVWILQEHKPNQWPNYQALVYDKADTACVRSWGGNTRQIASGKEIQGIQLNAFPRRDSKFYLRFMSWGQQGQHTSKEQFVISNPVRGKSFPKWTPDPLPDTQSDGDLDVTLNKLVANAPSPYGGNRVSKNDPASQCVQFDCDVLQKGQSATNWRPVQVETTDATGNDIKGWVNEYRPKGEQTGYYYESGLWPNEPAWKVRLEFSRTSGFNDDELWSVTNVPVHAGTQQEIWGYWGGGNPGATKAAFAETTIHGVHVKLFPAVQYTNSNRGFGNNSSKVVSIILKTDPDAESAGMRMTPLSITDDQGRPLNNQGSSWGNGNYQYEFAEPRNIDSVNVTIALHKSRFVEFTVKPAKQ